MSANAIDWPRLLEIRDLQPPDEPDIVVTLIDAFLEDAAARMVQLREAASTTELKRVRLLAHAIKGSASQMAAVRVENDAADVEAAALRSATIAELAPLVAKLSDSVAIASEVLRLGPPEA